MRSLTRYQESEELFPAPNYHQEAETMTGASEKKNGKMEKIHQLGTTNR